MWRVHTHPFAINKGRLFSKTKLWFLATTLYFSCVFVSEILSTNNLIFFLSCLNGYLELHSTI